MKKQLIKFLKDYFPRLALAYVLLRDGLPRNINPKETPMGFKLIGNKLMESGKFEPGETKVFISLLPLIDVVINIGANIGYYCCIALKHKKYVVAFEPIVQNLRYLLRNVTANGWGANIEIFPIALSDKVGVIDMYGGGTGASLIKGWASVSDQYTSLVPCSTLDIVLGSRFEGKNCLVMVDIEGAERLMLDGASSFLNMEPKPIWFMEISVQVNQPKGIKINPNLLSIFQEFWGRGYESWTTHNQNRIVTYNEIEKIIAGGVDTIWGDTILFINKEKHGEFNVLKSIG
jgi:FkbM family methyltransferase